MDFLKRNVSRLLVGLIMQAPMVVNVYANELNDEFANKICFKGVVSNYSVFGWNPTLSPNDYRVGVTVKNTDNQEFTFGLSSVNPAETEKLLMNGIMSALETATVSGHPVEITAINNSRCDATAHTKDLNISLCTKMDCT